MSTKVFNTIMINTLLTQATRYCIKNNMNYHKFSVFGYTWKMEKDIPHIHDYVYVNDICINDMTHKKPISHFPSKL